MHYLFALHAVAMYMRCADYDPDWNPADGVAVPIVESVRQEEPVVFGSFFPFPVSFSTIIARSLLYASLTPSRNSNTGKNRPVRKMSKKYVESYLSC